MNRITLHNTFWGICFFVVNFDVMSMLAAQHGAASMQQTSLVAIRRSGVGCCKRLSVNQSP
eukprot:1715627-Amphidinium_carterae.1